MCLPLCCWAVTVHDRAVQESQVSRLIPDAPSGAVRHDSCPGYVRGRDSCLAPSGCGCAAEPSLFRIGQCRSIADSQLAVGAQRCGASQILCTFLFGSAIHAWYHQFCVCAAGPSLFRMGQCRSARIRDWLLVPSVVVQQESCPGLAARECRGS